MFSSGQETSRSRSRLLWTLLHLWPRSGLVSNSLYFFQILGASLNRPIPIPSPSMLANATFTIQASHTLSFLSRKVRRSSLNHARVRPGRLGPAPYSWRLILLAQQESADGAHKLAWGRGSATCF